MNGLADGCGQAVQLQQALRQLRRVDPPPRYFDADDKSAPGTDGRTWLSLHAYQSTHSTPFLSGNVFKFTLWNLASEADRLKKSLCQCCELPTVAKHRASKQIFILLLFAAFVCEQPDWPVERGHSEVSVAELGAGPGWLGISARSRWVGPVTLVHTLVESFSCCCTCTCSRGSLPGTMPFRIF